MVAVKYEHVLREDYRRTIVLSISTGCKACFAQEGYSQLKNPPFPLPFIMAWLASGFNQSACVTYAGERIILTSRGKPKAALVSMQDYERLLKSDGRADDIQKWLAETRALSSRIEKRRGKPVDVDTLLEASRDDLETR